MTSKTPWNLCLTKENTTTYYTGKKRGKKNGKHKKQLPNLGDFWRGWSAGQPAGRRHELRTGLWKPNKTNVTKTPIPKNSPIAVDFLRPVFCWKKNPWVLRLCPHLDREKRSQTFTQKKPGSRRPCFLESQKWNQATNSSWPRRFDSARPFFPENSRRRESQQWRKQSRWEVEGFLLPAIIPNHLRVYTVTPLHCMAFSWEFSQKSPFPDLFLQKKSPQHTYIEYESWGFGL